MNIIKRKIICKIKQNFINIQLMQYMLATINIQKLDYSRSHECIKNVIFQIL